MKEENQVADAAGEKLTQTMMTANICDKLAAGYQRFYIAQRDATLRGYLKIV